MSWRDDTIADIRRDEECVLYAYQDQGGVWTIGYGHTRGVNPLDTCTKEQADGWLSEDLGVAERDLDIHVPWWGQAPDGIRRGLLNMCFNLGWPRLAGFKRMLEAGGNAQWSWMADEASDSDWFKEVGTRAVRVVALFRFADLGPEKVNV